jgi:hypothetical protein
MIVHAAYDLAPACATFLPRGIDEGPRKADFASHVLMGDGVTVTNRTVSHECTFSTMRLVARDKEGHLSSTFNG